MGIIENPTAMVEEAIILGRKVIPQFNGEEGVIRLEDYIKNDWQDGKTAPPEQIGGVFQYITVLDLDTVDDTDEIWLNDAVREEGNTNDRLDTIENNYSLNNFETCFVPPIMGTDEKPRDGRGRIIQAKRRGERFIPIYVYAYEDTSERARVGNGLGLNLTIVDSVPATRKDIIRGGLHLVALKELVCSEVPVRAWLNDDLKITKYFNTGNVTLIVKGILEQGSAGGEAVVRIKERTDWESWIKTHIGLTVDDKKVWLFSADNDTYINRAWCAVLSAVANCSDPIEIVLYSNRPNPSEARRRVIKFRDSLKKYHYASFRMVSNQIARAGTGAINPVEPFAYKILGVVPQILNKHDLDGKKLIPIDEY